MCGNGRQATIKTLDGESLHSAGTLRLHRRTGGRVMLRATVSKKAKKTKPRATAFTSEGGDKMPSPIQ